jgi:hypothetical protein
MSAWTCTGPRALRQPLMVVKSWLRRRRRGSHLRWTRSARRPGSALVQGPAPPRTPTAGVAPGLETGFAPPRSLGSAASLPVAATPLVGREDERAHVREIAHQPEHPAGHPDRPGGSGKTRLAMEVAARVVGAFPDGVFFVTLEAVTRTGEFWTGIAFSARLAVGG